LPWFLFHKKHNRTHLKHGRHFDYWNQPLNMCMHVCYLDWHKTGLCCYLMIHKIPYYVHYSYFVTYLLTLPRVCYLYMVYFTAFSVRRLWSVR
jgi:uncharacterized membrane protein